MKKFSVCILSSLLGFVTISANDSISTNYVKGEYISYCSVDIDAPMAVGDSVIADMITQLTSDFDSLFTWAFKGLGQQGDEERDEVVLHIKSSTFDRMSGLCHMVADIQVSKITTFRDIPLDSKVLQTKLEDGSTRVDVDIFYSNAILKKAYGTFFVKPIADNRIEMSVCIHVRFGWFFNIFITKKRFRNIIEWRMQGMMNNLRDEAEKRQTDLLQKQIQ